MSKKLIDTSGLSCPQPVLLVKQAVEAGDKDLDIIVDTEVARENVGKFLKKAGLAYKEEKDGLQYHLLTE
ncbi:MAG: sulfurtransferase TusA family protein [Bacillota bacterium]